VPTLAAATPKAGESRPGANNNFLGGESGCKLIPHNARQGKTRSVRQPSDTDAMNLNTGGLGHRELSSLPPFGLGGLCLTTSFFTHVPFVTRQGWRICPVIRMTARREKCVRPFCAVAISVSTPPPIACCMCPSPCPDDCC